MLFCCLIFIIFMKVQNNLDVRARKLLKDLLDEATEKMFNTRLKVYILSHWCALMQNYLSFLASFSFNFTHLFTKKKKNSSPLCFSLGSFLIYSVHDLSISKYIYLPMIISDCY